MGLTVQQANRIINMVQQAWAPLEVRRYREADAIYNNIIMKWESDPRVTTFANAYEKATGESFFVASGYGYGYVAGFAARFLDEAYRTWAEYIAGAKGGELYDALSDSGYHVKAKPDHMNFHNTTQSNTMDAALRTTRKDWARLSDAFAALVVNLAVVTTTTELLKAVEEFTDSLK